MPPQKGGFVLVTSGVPRLSFQDQNVVELRRKKELSVRNRFISAVALACFLGASLAMADVTMTQRKAARADRAERKAARQKAKAERPPKVNAKKNTRRRARSERAHGTLSEGSLSLIDSSGLQWNFNTDMTTATSTSISAAVSDASYTTSVTATTSLGGTSSTALDDAYDDGYNGLCVSLSGQTGPCVVGGGGGAHAPVRERGTGSPAPYIFYNQTGGPPTPDGLCGNRQYVFPILTAFGLQMQRKVFVPSNDSFARWLNIFTNTTGAPMTFNVIIDGNNLGSDGNTKIVTSTNGNAIAEVTDTWVTTFEDFSGGSSSDVRLGHVFQGPGAAIGLAGVTFIDGNDAPFWSYTMTLAPGETRIIMNFAVGQPSNAASAAKSAQLALLGAPAALACVSPAETAQIANFAAQLVSVPAVGPVGLALLGLALAVIGFAVVRRLS